VWHLAVAGPFAFEQPGKIEPHQEAAAVTVPLAVYPRMFLNPVSNPPI
jgi:hypothetical protein